MLTDTKIRNLKPKDRPYREKDSHGLYITVAVSGAKTWNQRYYWEKKEKLATHGHYPEMSLLDARQARDRLKQLVKQGVNPKEQSTASATKSQTFKEMFLKWHNSKKDEWSVDYAEDVTQRAKCYLLPFIGNKPIDSITPPEMRELLLKIQERGVLDTLQKVKSIASRVFSFSVGMGTIGVNPVRDLPSDIFKAKPQKNYATITDPKEIGWLLRLLDEHKGSYQVRTALLLAPYLMLRPGELTKLTWKEVDFDARLIRVSEETMKMKKPHLVPMSEQVYRVLQELSYIESGSDYVFPSPRNRRAGITTNSLLGAIRSLGIDKETFTTHGFRHMASTRLNELGFKDDVIERQLSHTDKNKIRAVYNHAEYLEERKEMMQQWSDYLGMLKADALNQP